ncbi:MAG: rhodanese-like domain-containing protein [Mycobacteriales bacterium]
MQRITRDELQAALDRGSLTLIEALSEMHYAAGHLPGARHVPDALTVDLAASVAPDKAQTVVVYCSGPSCGRSRVTGAAFERLGYRDVRVYEGGKSDWLSAGLPLTAAAAAVS